MEDEGLAGHELFVGASGPEARRVSGAQDVAGGGGARAKPADFGYIDAPITVETVQAFVKQSKQSTARVIQAGGPMTGFREPPPGADGWRLDAWPDLWTFNMAERWEQWQRDFAEFGHIKFIEQSFDGFPEKSDGYGGGFDAWNHLQLTLDSKAGTCQVLLQVIGEAPRILVETNLSPAFAAGMPFSIELICDRKQPRDDGPAFDNLQLTRVAP